MIKQSITWTDRTVLETHGYEANFKFCYEIKCRQAGRALL